MQPSSRASSPERLTRIAVAVLVALALAVVVSVFGAEGSAAPGGRLGGDLPAFYGAGRIAADGAWDDLYDPARQVTAQADLWEEEGEYLYFAYPPFVAAAYRLLVPFGYRGAYLVHTALMGLAALGAVLALRPMLGRYARLPTVVVFAGAVTFYPMLRAVFGGQNSALTLLILALVLRLEWDGKPWQAGAAAALLLYKPQFGVPLALLLVAGRRWRMAGGWAAVAAALYGVSALWSRPAWVVDWWEQAADFRALNADVNGENFISVPGVVEHLLGGDAGFVTLVVFGLALGGGAALTWRRLPDRPELRMAVAASVLVVLAPQALFYEAALMLLPFALLAAGRTDLSPWAPAVVWGAGLLHVLSPAVGFSLLVVVPVGAVYLSLRDARSALGVRVAPV